jgi:lipid-A-disaccharide synthase-like uncharacterized protein
MSIDNLSSVISFLLNPWILLGFFGQFLFFMRFVIQWLASEKKGRVVVPKLFWYFSISGTLVLLIYSVHIMDVVFITAQILSLFIYGRNLALERRFALQEVTVNAERSEPV